MPCLRMFISKKCPQQSQSLQLLFQRVFILGLGKVGLSEVAKADRYLGVGFSKTLPSQGQRLFLVLLRRFVFALGSVGRADVV
jgi:hypothetical protein